MFKALLKKQLLELNQYYFYDRKNNKKRTSVGTVLMFVLFGFIFISLCFAFYGLAEGFSIFLTVKETEWIFFSVMSLLAVILGAVGSVFNTYSGLYRAKDNDLLLSMPIKPGYILLVRILGVYLMSLLYTSLVFIPAMIKYWIAVKVTVLQVIFPIINLFLITLFVTVIACAFGFVVAIIANKIKNKSFITVISTLLFISLYYYVYFSLGEVVERISEHVEETANIIKTWLYPIYHLGLSSSGNVISFIVFLLFSSVLFTICYFVLSKTFIKTVTTSIDTKVKVNNKEKIKFTSSDRTLLNRELKHFLSSPIYMLNVGLGSIITILASIVLIIKAKTLYELYLQLVVELPMVKELAPIVVATVICMISAMNGYTAPSISIEGKNLWILKSLPVDTYKILLAKEKVHFGLSAIPAVIITTVIAIILKLSVLNAVFIILYSLLFICFLADFGLFFGIKKPILNWTNETVPVKQSIAVMFDIFGGWLISILVAVLYYFIYEFINSTVYLVMITGIVGIVFYLLHSWVMTKGVAEFENL